MKQTTLTALLVATGLTVAGTAKIISDRIGATEDHTTIGSINHVVEDNPLMVLTNYRQGDRPYLGVESINFEPITVTVNPAYAGLAVNGTYQE